MSPREIVGHLIQMERENWVPRIRQILESGEQSPFGPFDFAKGLLISREFSVEELLTEFAGARRASLDDLERLGITDVDLGKTGTHPKFGPVTLDQLLSTWVAHDLYHCGQTFKAFAAPFQSSVGPWQEFLNLPHFN